MQIANLNLWQTDDEAKLLVIKHCVKGINTLEASSEARMIVNQLQAILNLDMSTNTSNIQSLAETQIMLYKAKNEGVAKQEDNNTPSDRSKSKLSPS